MKRWSNIVRSDIMLKSTSVGLHFQRQADTAREAFVEMCGPARAFIRQHQINQLKTVEWKGKTLYALRCHGTSGKGPHDTNVPESLLWSLIDLRAFRCPYHANDWLEPPTAQQEIRATLDAIDRSEQS